MKEFLKIGGYSTSTGVIVRELHGQGYIFKDEEAFRNHNDKPCYAPELTDAVYTRQDFINLCGGREDFARECFDIVDWQSPETWIQEQFVHGEWSECPVCKHWYSRYAVPQPCEKCGGGAGV